uniref:4Fe-4S dicluster domain-containing protein n=1 Tax=Ignisphaera aggregans TaxID=334771 RepID=A0A7J3QE41_9CREN
MSYKVYVDQTKCIGCAQCYAACPNKVFSIVNKKSIPEHADKCVGCRACIVKCPTNAITIEARDVEALYARFYST